MTLMSSTAWLKKAQKEEFALGACNANTLEQVQAIVRAAQLESAPVIIQISRRAANYLGQGSVALGLRYAAEVGKIAATSVEVPVMLHFDHGKADEVLIAAELGFTSVMFDGADLPMGKNIRATQEICRKLQPEGIGVEAEIGEVPRKGDGHHEVRLTDPEQASLFVQETGVDALAIAIGSIHAVTRKEVSLNLDRLRSIRSLIDIPLVLHGSSGVKDDDILSGIKLGLCKINVATQFNMAFTSGLKAHIEANPDLVDPRPYLSAANQAMVVAVQARLRLFGAAGKAVPIWEV